VRPPSAPLFTPSGPDQAHELRLMAANRRTQDSGRRLAPSTRVIAVTSGKGGVGKTNLVVNLAVTLARWGKKVIILDCDLGTANVDVMLGIHSRYSLQHVLLRQRQLHEVMGESLHGVRVISGGSGLQDMANLTETRREELLTIFASLEGQADILLLDTGAGISENVIRFVIAAGEAIVVTTPEPTAVTDAYALIKVVSHQASLRGRFPKPFSEPGADQSPATNGYGGSGGIDDLRLRLVVNQAVSEVEARETVSNISAVAKRFLNVDVEPFGSIPLDRCVAQAVRKQVPVVDAFPRSAAAGAFERLAAHLVAIDPGLAAAGSVHGQAGQMGRSDAFPPSLPTAENSARPIERTKPAPTIAVHDGQRAPTTVRGIGMFMQRMFGATRGRLLG
jgi:flagellar biosynthesis protein FlhG